MKKYKLILPNKVHLLNDVSLIFGILSKSPKYAEIYKQEKGWRKIAELYTPDNCACGLAWNKTENGEQFIFRSFRQYVLNEESLLLFCKDRPLCQRCYYLIEYNAGRFCPKFWRNQFDMIQ